MIYVKRPILETGNERPGMSANGVKTGNALIKQKTAPTKRRDRPYQGGGHGTRNAFEVQIGSAPALI